jgi:hypothetical protein
MSPTLVAGLTIAALAGLLALLYFVVLPRTRATAKAPSKNATEMAAPGQAGSMQPVHPLAKHVEVSGVRITEEGKNAKIQFLVTNHSPADLPELAMRITIRGGGREFFQFPVAVPSMGPFESKELSSSVATTLKPYELPDWQLVQLEFRITSAP